MRASGSVSDGASSLAVIAISAAVGLGSQPGRPFDHGELRYILLTLISEKPRHGYELIKAIEERSGGIYTPSPGVVYPTLTMLEEMNYVALDHDRQQEGVLDNR